MSEATGISEALAMIEESGPVDAARIEERAAALTSGEGEGVSDLFLLDLAVRCTDLTSLELDDTPEKIAQMCATAIRPDPSDPSIPSVAAVCIYPALVPTAAGSVKGTTVKVAGVAGGFPGGDVPTATKLLEIREALEAGADEIDMTLNRDAFLAGRYRETFEEVAAAKEVCGDVRLKVILETAKLGSYDHIRKASMLVMAAGADFVKTSTGKTVPGATFPAALCIMEAIRDLHGDIGRQVGIKVSGGIRRADQARRYLLVLQASLGAEWLRPDLFRIGASSLLEDLLEEIRTARRTEAPRSP
jgi:deoxyribose-phosphate aldolase